MNVLGFKQLSPDDRVRALMVLSEDANLSNYPIFEYAILSDKDNDVQMAALKRIHKFKAIADTEGLLKHRMSEKSYAHLEPYFSMALLHVGIISEAEFNAVVNGSNPKPNTSNTKTFFNWSIFRKKNR
jgi:hypothetical protein